MKDLIFISYRREDSSTFASILYSEFGKYFLLNNLFKDHNTLVPGGNFKHEIDHSLEKTSVLVVLISKNWLQPDENKISRLFKDDDMVKHEILTAIQNDINIIPVLFENAKLPLREELPESLWPLTDKQAFIIHPETVFKDISALIEIIKSKRNFKYDEKTLFGSTERLFKNPLENLKTNLKEGTEIYKKDFNTFLNFLKKKQ